MNKTTSPTINRNKSPKTRARIKPSDKVGESVGVSNSIDGNCDDERSTFVIDRDSLKREIVIERRTEFEREGRGVDDGQIEKLRVSFISSDSIKIFDRTILTYHFTRYVRHNISLLLMLECLMMQKLRTKNTFFQTIVHAQRNFKIGQNSKTLD
jgi:hypothetical protein